MLGEEQTSVNGFPEGCCLSVVAMLVTAWSYTVEVEAAVADADPGHLLERAVYADKFEVFGKDQTRVSTAITATCEWAEAFKVLFEPGLVLLLVHRSPCLGRGGVGPAPKMSRARPGS